MRKARKFNPIELACEWCNSKKGDSAQVVSAR